MDYPVYSSNVMSEIDINVFIEEKNKTVNVKLTPSTPIRDIIDQISDFMVLPPEEKELRGLFHNEKILDPDTTIEKNAIQSKDTVVFKKSVDPNSILVNVDLLDGRSFQFYVNPLSALAEIANSMSNLLSNPQDKGLRIAYEFMKQDGTSLDIFESISRLGIKNNDRIQCKRVTIGGNFQLIQYSHAIYSNKLMYVM